MYRQIGVIGVLLYIYTTLCQTANHNNEKPVFYGILPQSKCPILLKVFVLHNKKFFFTGKLDFFSHHVNHIYHTEERKKTG